MRPVDLERLKKKLEKWSDASVPVLAKLEIAGLPGFLDISTEPKVPVLAICGGTGVGKTALLEMLSAALQPAPANETIGGRERLRGATCTVTVTREGAEPFVRSVTAGEVSGEESEGFPGGVTFIGLADRTSNISDFLEDVDVEALLEGAAPVALSAEELGVVSVICGKAYTRATFVEVERQDDLSFPFFEVEEGGVTYTSRAMATGELSALYIAWSLRSSEVQSVFLIEEPEAFLPPSSHPLIFGLISKSTVDRKLLTIFTTHSAYIASHVPRKYLVSLARRGGKTVLVSTNDAKERALARLGLQPTKSVVLLVEDQLAYHVLIELQARFGLSLICNVEVIKPGEGFGAVKKILDASPVGMKSVEIVGVLDGDMRDKAGRWVNADRFQFLPFESSMEEEFLAIARSDTADLANIVGRTEAAVHDAIEAQAGADPHDFYMNFGSELGLPAPSLAKAFLDLWLTKAPNLAKAKSFARDLAKSLGLELPEG